MRLYFLRHAEAVDGVDDAIRPLSPHGRLQCRDVGRWLSRLDIEFDAVFSSPLVRARQTAERVVKETGVRGTGLIQEVPALLNGTGAPAFARWLKGLTRFEHVLLVGHAPTLDERVRRLLGMERLESFKFPKAGLACVDTEDGSVGTLRFFVTPKVI